MTTSVHGAHNPVGANLGGPRESRSDDDEAASSFASVLAGVTQPQPRSVARAKKDEGTSELDGKDESADADDGSGEKNASVSTSSAVESSAKIADSTALLDPALQEKLARVMARMRAETGHNVQVTETYRTQARQDTLYAQGRGAPGPVVTWTQQSKHTQGRAVDVLVDAGHAGADAYTALQRIASEEGLRTLGARDPGHLELPTAGSMAGARPDATSIIPAAPADATGPGQVSIVRLAQVATVAQVSQVAKPAQVARVASVARPEVTNSHIRPTNVEPKIAVPSPNAIAAGGLAARANTESSAEEQGQQQRGDRSGGGYGAAFGVRAHPAGEFSLPSVASSVAASATHRAAQVIAAMEDAPARPLSQIVMSVDAGNGATDRIEVVLRGSSLSTTIDASDHQAAQAMRTHSDELVRALTRDGVDVESLRIRAAASTVAPLAVDSSQRSSDSSAGSRFERGAQWQQQHNQQRSDGERRQHQRDQRGGRDT